MGKCGCLLERKLQQEVKVAWLVPSDFHPFFTSLCYGIIGIQTAIPPDAA